MVTLITEAHCNDYHDDVARDDCWCGTMHRVIDLRKDLFGKRKKRLKAGKSVSRGMERAARRVGMNMETLTTARPLVSDQTLGKRSKAARIAFACILARVPCFLSSLRYCVYHLQASTCGQNRRVRRLGQVLRSGVRVHTRACFSSVSRDLS